MERSIQPFPNRAGTGTVWGLSPPNGICIVIPIIHFNSKQFSIPKDWGYSLIGQCWLNRNPFDLEYHRSIPVLPSGHVYLWVSSVGCPFYTLKFVEENPNWIGLSLHGIVLIKVDRFCKVGYISKISRYDWTLFAT
jgi:hypothetical protein